MSFSLYASTVPTFLQLLASTRTVLGKAAAWGREKGFSEADMLGWRLAEDMFPLGLQVVQLVAHSSRAVDAVARGIFTPDLSGPDVNFAACAARIGQAVDFLEAVEPRAFNALVGRDMRFEFGDRRMHFSAEEFLFTFSQPNFFFHVSTAYGILRSHGLPIGKGDYMGAIRLKPLPGTPDA